jgi:hypothetical protein
MMEQAAVMIVHVKSGGYGELPEIGPAIGLPTARLRRSQSREQQSGQDGNHRNDHQQLNQSEPAFLSAMAAHVHFEGRNGRDAGLDAKNF